MTEKRFECDKGSRIIIDNETGLHYIMTLDWECGLVTKLLNRFADENEQLKSEIEKLSYPNEDLLSEKRNWQRMSDEYCKLTEENEQLKKKIVSLEVELDTHKHPLWSTREAERVVNKLKEENEELKKEVEMLRNGLKAYDESLPLYLDCEDIMHFNNRELFEFKMERMDFYKKYPNRIHYK